MTLEAQLADLASHLDVPAGDALATRVGARVRARRRRAAGRRLAIVFGAVVVLALAVSFAPAVADWLGIDGGGDWCASTPPPSPPGSGVGFPSRRFRYGCCAW